MPELDEEWADVHSVTCLLCGELADEREAATLTLDLEEAAPALAVDSPAVFLATIAGAIEFGEGEAHQDCFEDYVEEVRERIAAAQSPTTASESGDGCEHDDAEWDWGTVTPSDERVTIAGRCPDCEAPLDRVYIIDRIEEAGSTASTDTTPDASEETVTVELSWSTFQHAHSVLWKEYRRVSKDATTSDEHQATAKHAYDELEAVRAEVED